MLIRPALPRDARDLAKLMNLAMIDITFQMIGQENPILAEDFLTYFIAQKDNQYSYQNITVLEDEQGVQGHICIYDGARLKSLRQPIEDFIKSRYEHKMLMPEETQAGEYYIDTLAVRPEAQGKGYAKQLIQYAQTYYCEQRQQRLGLLVDLKNPKAKKLYSTLGFKTLSQRALFETVLEHMQYPDPATR